MATEYPNRLQLLEWLAQLHTKVSENWDQFIAITSEETGKQLTILAGFGDDVTCNMPQHAIEFDYADLGDYDTNQNGETT